MIRAGMWAVLIAALAMVALDARAQTAVSGENEDARFTFHRVDDGYLRLDGRSGQVSLCARRAVGWLCQALPDDRTALEAEIARLQTDNVALKKELLAHKLALPANVRPDPPPANTGRPRLRLPNDAEIEHMMAFFEKVWRRVVDLILTAQRDVLRRS